jgi:hypothetical protein
MAAIACGSADHPTTGAGTGPGSGAKSGAGSVGGDSGGASDVGGSDSTAAGSSGTGGLSLIGLGGDSQGGGDGGGGGDGDGDSSCELGEVSSTGTNENLDLFGRVVYFADGIALPAGRYRTRYVDGCMKYSSAQDWAIHAYPNAEPDGWWFVGADTTDKVVVPPGTIGFLVSNGGFATFDECVAANLLLPPVDFDFAGGKLGVWLQDSPYSDNAAGVDNRNPKWTLTLLGDCDRIQRPK